MNYSRIQKFLSFALIFFLLGSITFRVPLLSISTSAAADDFYNLVSIIVNEDIYDDIEDELNRYSKDISGVLDNTKVVILPTPSDGGVLNIASLNEGLYFEGLKSIQDVNFESKLVGTVIVGELPLPIVTLNNNSSTTLLPYVDFIDKQYVYNHNNSTYEENKKSINDFKAEIWHGVISPNTGDTSENIQSIKDYFSKNHDFYTGKNNFDASKGVINGNKEDNLDINYQPYVFYYDQFREQQSVNYLNYKAYEGYANNKEDLAYNRYNKELAEKLKNEILFGQNEELNDLIKKVDPNIDPSLLTSGPDLENIPDVQSRHIIDKTIKKFVEVFSKGSIGDLRKDVHNAGRYNGTGGIVNADFIPYLITVLDTVNDEVIKKVNTDIEDKIDDLVENGLSRKIPIATEYTINGALSGSGVTSCNQAEYVNFLYGKQASSITTAEECSIYRGSLSNGGNLVEANRAYNIGLIESDISRINSIDSSVSPRFNCIRNIGNGQSTQGFWGGNSPANLNIADTFEGGYNLKSNSYKKSISPLFDIKGGKKSVDSSKVLSPLNCSDENFIQTKAYSYVFSGFDFGTCELSLNVPYNSSSNPSGWYCTKDNGGYDLGNTFSGLYGSIGGTSTDCTITELYLDNSLVKSRNYVFGFGDLCTPVTHTYRYKSIPSIIKHKSPTSVELSEQINSMLAPDLPIDKNRYVDFIGAGGSYAKINYPYLFRQKLDSSTELNLENVKSMLEDYLTDQSSGINNIISSNSPSGSTYNLFKTGTYPTADINLVEYLKNKPQEVLKIGADTKNVNYFDTLAFAVYWNNLDSVSAKYKFIFENYLSDQFGNDSLETPVIKNKKQYEISYLGAPGDAQNMYIKVDPDHKKASVYGDIVSKNISLNAQLSGYNTTSTSNIKGDFKCAPPEGVPLWEWIPAVLCWLGEMLPPTISISDGACGPSLLSDDEREEIKICSGDVNKNGINDCIEKKFDGASIALLSDSDKYYYSSNGKIYAEIRDKNNTLVTIDNTTNIEFELQKVNSIDGSDVNTIFDVNNSQLNSQTLVKDYIAFKNNEVRVSGGKAEYGFSSLRKDVDYYFKAKISIQDSNGNESIFLESDDLKVEVRGDRLFANSFFIEESDQGPSVTTGINTLRASDQIGLYLIDNYRQDIDDIVNLISGDSLGKEKLVIAIDNVSSSGNNIALSYPLNVKVLINIEETIYENTLNTSSLNLFHHIPALKKSGNYTLEIIDSNGYKVKRTFEVQADFPSQIDIKLGSDLLKSQGALSTNVVSVLDRYGNPTAGELYNIDMSLSNGNIVFEENRDASLALSTFEGYKVFRLLSTQTIGETTLSISVSDAQGKIYASNTTKIDVLDDINLFVKPIGESPKVGGGAYQYEISLRDSSGKIVGDYNSRVYTYINSIYGSSVDPYVLLTNGVGIVDLQTSSVAAKKVPVEFQIEGLGEIIHRNISILPESPMKVDLGLSSSKMEASANSQVKLIAELKDRYGNVVFTDNSTTLSTEILDEYKDIISIDSTFKKAEEGTASFIISGTNNPGIGYFKVQANPGLENNTFVVSDGNSSLTLSGVSENVGSVETFYFWNKEKIEKGSYNGLYTTLLGSSYGDITQKDYLAGSLLFDKNNRSLAVTSLLNNPYNFNDIVSLGSAGNVLITQSSSDLTQDTKIGVDIVDKNIQLSLYNQSLNQFIGKLAYNIGDINLVSCDGSLSCDYDGSQRNALLSSLNQDYKTYIDGSDLFLQDRFGKKILNISESGDIQKAEAIDLSIVSTNTKNNLILDISLAGRKISQLLLHIPNIKVNVSRDEGVFESKLQSLANSANLLLVSNSYSSRVIDNGVDETRFIYYNDPFATKYNLNDFSRQDQDGYENFAKKSGLGWKDGNKSLLAFSSGDSVGKSTQDYMSFSLINLGDPVVSLKKIAELPSFIGQGDTYNSSSFKHFDSTIGSLISSDEDINSYNIFDYNNDNYQDVLLIKNDGYLHLYENNGGMNDFNDRGNLAYVVDGGNSDLILTGDFTSDGYDDIFFVNNDGDPYLLNNNKKDFLRLSLIDQLALDGRIIRAQVFDMDSDNYDDIVTLDDSGKINIFYGTNTSGVFEKVNISDSYGIILDNSLRNDNGYVYFNGLKQIDSNPDYSEELLSDGDKYTDELRRKLNQANQNNSQSDDLNLDEEQLNTQLLDKFIFENILFDPDFTVTENSQHYLQETIGSIDIPNSVELSSSVGDTKNLLDEFISTQSGFVLYSSDVSSVKDSTFIKSEYSDYYGVSVSKYFKDINGGYLQSEDKVEVTVDIKNTSNSPLNNIAYVEDIEDVFKLNQNSLEISSVALLSFDIPNHSFIVNSFSLAPDESITLTYMLDTRALSYGYIQTGLFEEGELGDDNYGDVILKPNFQNCSAAVEIFRSTNNRSYTKGIKNPSCDESITGDDNLLDSDNNGVPDYIDAIVNGTDTDKSNYAQDTLSSLFTDSDNDGVPDNEDLVYYKDSGGDDGLNSFVSDVSSGLDGVENIINGLSCGFGGAGCVSTPLNWAPLAPGGDPTLFGQPIGDGLKVSEGIPVFSALTGNQTTCGNSPCCLPTVWPASAKGYIPGPVCGPNSAGGTLGVNNPTNFFRFFATPTLTGGAGIAACFGGPAIVAGYSNMPGIAPLMPGGNCVVIAAPLMSCSDDGSDGYVPSVGFSYGEGDYGVYNANCSAQNNNSTPLLDKNLVTDYLDYSTTGKVNQNLITGYKDQFTNTSSDGNSNIPESLFSFNADGEGSEFSVEVDSEALKSGDFSDVLKINKSRISPFPSFLMDWATRQIEEIATKLTDFPTLYVILPDFSGIFDGNWGEKTGALNAQGNYEGDFITLPDQIENKKIKSRVSGVNSGIKEAYEFIANIPLVHITQETVNVNFPYIDQASLNKTIETRGNSLDAYKQELEKAKNAWSFGAACSGTQQEKESCEERNAISKKVVVDMENLISSLEKNLEVLNDYKTLPQKINKIINKKQYYLEQVLCNIEAISKVFGGWIDDNGERFKAWVDLYILIKAILKSWQLLVDVFIDYDAECHECKNERSDLLDFQFKLIDMVIPKIPVIQFPKWPDIILDLHNVRARLDIPLPEYSVGVRPIVLPELPIITLPDVPTLTIHLPSLDILPMVEIPELPDLPSLPMVELPNLPPPPTLPKMFASLEAIVDILKLVTKAMCILKSSPFVPEWRAGDQIAFLTERQGYLSLDFLDLSLPQFSFPFVDAIKVTTYVNLEFEVDFIVELARQAAMPINSFTNDMTHILDIELSDVELDQIVPNEIDIDLGAQNKSQDYYLGMIAVLVSKKIGELAHFMESNKEIRVSNAQFKKLVGESLAGDSISSDPRYDELRDVWNEVYAYNFSKENEVIGELLQNNIDKFEVLGDIIETEISKVKIEKQNLDKYLEPTFITQVSDTKNNDIEAYNNRLKPFNDKVVNSYVALIEGKDEVKESLQNQAQDLIAQVKTPLDRFAQASQEELFVATTSIATPVTSSSSAQTTCQQRQNSEYKYNYEGIYITQDNELSNGPDEFSYRLFDYLDEVTGKETIQTVDIDNDGDDDIFYFVNGQLYLKENLDNQSNDSTSDENPLVISAADNKFYSDEFSESVNNFDEVSVTSDTINVNFSSPTYQTNKNFRLEFYSIIDKFSSLDSLSYQPQGVTKTIIDAFADIDDETLIRENDIYTTSENLGVIKSIGWYKGLTLITPRLKNIKTDIDNNIAVTLGLGTTLYAGDSTVRLKYIDPNTQEEKGIVLQKNQNLQIKQPIQIVGISSNAYIQQSGNVVLSSDEIRQYVGMPLLPTTTFKYSGGYLALSESSYIDIEYYDGTQATVDLRETDYYQAYDLGYSRESYTLRVNKENDYYYAKIRTFFENNYSTFSQSILLSPQIEADNIAPSLSLKSSIRVPVYQKKIIDLSNHIYEEGGIGNISDVIIDFNLDIDSDQDGNLGNDNDNSGIKVLKNLSSIKLEVGPFEELIKKNIGITLIDKNGNKSFTQAGFEVYAPIPSINTLETDKIDGVIDEVLSDEPVGLYRYRAGVIQQLSDEQGEKITNTQQGNYTFELNSSTGGLILESQGNIYATVNEKTGLIDIKSNLISSRVLSSNHSDNTNVYPKIILDKTGVDLYYQYMKVTGEQGVKIIDDFANISDNSGIYLMFTNKQSYNSFQIPEAVSYNPGSTIIYRNTDLTKEPLFTLHRDGRIETLNDFYGLEYDYYDDYIVFKLMDRHFDREVARVLYKVTGDYIMK